MSSNPQVTIGVTAVDKASGVLRSLDQQVLGTTSKIDESSTKAAKSTEKSSASMIKSYASIAGSVASLGAGIVSFATSFSTLEKAQNRVDQANLSLERSQVKLEKMQASGTVTAEQLAIAQEDVRVKTNLAKVAQDDLSDTTTNFYAQIPAQLTSFGSSAVMAYSAYTASAKTADAATKATSFSIKGLFVSLGPIGWAILGISTLVTLLATNTFGLRDAFESAGKVIFEFIEIHLKPLADFIRWVIDGFNALGAGLDDTQKAYADAGAATSEFTNETVNTGTAVGKTAKEVETYISYLQDLRQDTEDTTIQNLWLIESLDKETAALVKNRFEIELVADFLQDQQNELQRTQQENFSLVASIDGVDRALKSLRDGSLTQVADKLRELQDEAKETSKEIDEMIKKAKVGSLEDRARAAFGDLGDVVRSSDHRISFVKRNAEGGIIDEPTLMLGMRTGKLSTAGEMGKETIVPGNGTGVNIYVENKIITSDPNTRVETRVRTMQSRRRSVIQ